LSLIPFQIDPSIYLELALLFGITAQFKGMDGFSFLNRLISRVERRVGVLYTVAVITIIFSPFILNDVVILILTPVLVKYSKDSERDIAPLAVAMVTFTNIASSLTPIGNPQNILLWQATGISSRDFVLGTWMPLSISGLLVAACLYPLRRKVDRHPEEPTAWGPKAPAVYLATVATIIFSLDTTGIPKTLVLTIAFLLGFVFTRRTPWRLVAEYDFKSLLILCVLVSLVAVLGFIIRPLFGPYATQAALGIQPYSAILIAVLSNVMSNVPATQLILSVATVPMGAATRIAVAAGLAGNIGPIGSFANILALMIIRRNGLSIRRTLIFQFIIGTISFVPALL
jgi:Na+/H+ antiporter NhaD/arsenite permease-like protein